MNDKKQKLSFGKIAGVVFFGGFVCSVLLYDYI